MLRKLFPAGVGTEPVQTFKIVLLAEGFQGDQRRAFQDVCREFVLRFLSTPPFQLTRQNPDWVTVLGGFVPSAEVGAAIGQPMAGRTAFDSAYDPVERALSIDQQRVNDLLGSPQTSVPFADGALPLSDLYTPGSPGLSRFGTLIAILMPPIGAEPEGVSYEPVVAPEDFHFVATTTDHRWEQVVIRGVCAALGLGDEFDLPQPEFAVPPNGALDAGSINLQFFDEPPASNREAGLKWSNFLTAAEKHASAIVHPRTEDSATFTLPTVPATPSTIEFWEGAGRYRSKIYRSAEDCLMRRRIGDRSKPVADGLVPLCRVCRTYLSGMVG